MPVARIGAVKLHYQVHGSGEPLLLIMGYRASSHMWDESLLAPLSRYFQVITFDNRGTGHSDKPNAVYTIPMMADDAAGILNHLGIAQAHVFGVSMGGMIAQELALRYPRQLDRLILGCTTCGGHQATMASFAIQAQLLTPPNLTREEAVRRQWPMMLGAAFVKSRPDVLDRLTDLALAYPTPGYSAIRQAMAIRWFDTGGRLGRIEVPTLVVAGSADVLVPPVNSYLLAEHIPDSALAVMPDAGHGFFWEQPDDLVDLLTEFCGVGAPLQTAKRCAASKALH